MPFHAFPIPEVFFPDCQMQLILLFWGLRSVIQGQPQWQRAGRKTKLLPLEASRLHGHIAWPDWKWLRMIEWWSKMQQNASSKKDAKGGQRGKDSKRFEKPPAIFTGFQTTSRRVVFPGMAFTDKREVFVSQFRFWNILSTHVLCRRLSSFVLARLRAASAVQHHNWRLPSEVDSQQRGSSDLRVRARTFVNDSLWFVAVFKMTPEISKNAVTKWTKCCVSVSRLDVGDDYFHVDKDRCPSTMRFHVFRCRLSMVFVEFLAVSGIL